MFLAHKDAINDKTMTTCHSIHSPNSSRPERATTSPGTLCADAACTSISPSGAARLVFQSGAAPATIEIWRGLRKVREVEVADRLHGALVLDGYCSTGPVWSPDEAFVAYVAEVR